MKKIVGKPRSFKEGDLVVVKMGLTSKCDRARLSVWSKCGDYPYSPHVPLERIPVLMDGRPMMLSPMRCTLDTHMTSKVIQFTADEAMVVCIMQEVDSDNEPLASAKVKRHGKIEQAIRRSLRNAFRAFRNRPAREVGSDGRNGVV